MALGALGFVASEHQGLELVLALLADVLEDRHGLPRKTLTFI